MSPISMTLSKPTLEKSHFVFSFTSKAVPLPLLVMVAVIVDCSPASMVLLGINEFLSEYSIWAIRSAGKVRFSLSSFSSFIIYIAYIAFFIATCFALISDPSVAFLTNSGSL